MLFSIGFCKCGFNQLQTESIKVKNLPSIVAILCRVFTLMLGTLSDPEMMVKCTEDVIGYMQLLHHFIQGTYLEGVSQLIPWEDCIRHSIRECSFENCSHLL
jgi:hypothetical protein